MNNLEKSRQEIMQKIAAIHGKELISVTVTYNENKVTMPIMNQLADFKQVTAFVRRNLKVFGYESLKDVKKCRIIFTNGEIVKSLDFKQFEALKDLEINNLVGFMKGLEQQSTVKFLRAKYNSFEFNPMEIDKVTQEDLNDNLNHHVDRLLNYIEENKVNEIENLTNEEA